MHVLSYKLYVSIAQSRISNNITFNKDNQKLINKWTTDDIQCVNQLESISFKLQTFHTISFFFWQKDEREKKSLQYNTFKSIAMNHPDQNKCNICENWRIELSSHKSVEPHFMNEKKSHRICFDNYHNFMFDFGRFFIVWRTVCLSIDLCRFLFSPDFMHLSIALNLFIHLIWYRHKINITYIRSHYIIAWDDADLSLLFLRCCR